MSVELVGVAYDDPVVAALIAELQLEIAERYGSQDETPVDPREFAAPTGAFLVAMDGDQAVGCVGLRRHDDDTVELKRMFVRRPRRRGGLARVLLRAAEHRARELGYARLALETGTQQPEAVALYESAGYEPITDFGHYRDHPESRAFARDLREPDADN